MYSLSLKLGMNTCSIPTKGAWVSYFVYYLKCFNFCDLNLYATYIFNT